MTPVSNSPKAYSCHMNWGDFGPWGSNPRLWALRPVSKMASKALGLIMRKNSKTDKHSGWAVQARKFINAKVHSCDVRVGESWGGGERERMKEGEREREAHVHWDSGFYMVSIKVLTVINNKVENSLLVVEISWNQGFMLFLLYLVRGQVSWYLPSWACLVSYGFVFEWAGQASDFLNNWPCFPLCWSPGILAVGHQRGSILWGQMGLSRTHLSSVSTILGLYISHFLTHLEYQPSHLSPGAMTVPVSPGELFMWNYKCCPWWQNYPVRVGKCTHTAGNLQLTTSLPQNTQQPSSQVLISINICFANISSHRPLEP